MVTFRANIYGPLDGRMVIIQLCRWNFHTKKLCRLCLIEIELDSKKQKNRFSTTLWGP